MKEDFLKGLGLEDDIIGKVLAESESEVKAERGKVEMAEGKLKSAEDTIKNLQADLEKFDGTDVEELRKSAADWEAKYNTEKSRLESELKNQKIDAAVNLALTTAKAKNTKAVRALLDIDPDKAEIGDDGKLKGLDEQIKALTEAEDSKFLFNMDKQNTPTFKGFKLGESSRDGIPSEAQAGFESRLAEARKNNDTVGAISIKEEAAAEGIILM